MIKFVLITLLLWFVISRILRFKMVVYKGSQSNSTFGGYKTRASEPEGTLRVDKEAKKNKNVQDSKEGDYVEYEEV